MKKLLKKLRLYPANSKRAGEEQEKIAKLQERIKARDQRIAEMKERIEVKNSYIADFNVAVKTLNAEKETLSEEIAALQSMSEVQSAPGEVLHEIATRPFGSENRVASDVMSGVMAMSDPRAMLAYRYLRGEGLEIGAMHSPLPLPPGASARYYDYRTAEESLRAYPDLPADKVVKVDYVGDGETLDLIADESLDFLIANHMLEHCQDVIRTLRVFYRKLRQEGVMYISLPDLRYTFDHRRKPTPFEHLERDEREGPGVSLYEHYRELSETWSGEQLNAVPGELGLNDASTVLNEEEFAKAAEGRHINWHFHAWTQSEILEMFIRLGSDHGFDWEIESCMRNGIEVIVVLRKTKVRVADRALEAESGPDDLSAGGNESVKGTEAPVAEDKERSGYQAFIDDTDDPIIGVEETWSTEADVNMRGWVASREGELPELQLSVSGREARVDWDDRPDLVELFPDLSPGAHRGFRLHVPKTQNYDLGLRFQRGGESVERQFEVPGTGRPEWPFPKGGDFGVFLEEVDQPGKRVLEIGSRLVSPGATSKRSTFKHAEYVGFDYHPDSNTDVVGDAHKLSQYFEPDERFDGIFSNAVLEHLAMPWAAVLEMNRMLKPGGLVFHNVPYSWPWHEAPWDFWRFSHHGLGVLFSAPLGFEIVKSGLLGPARIVPDEREEELRDFWSHPAYLGAEIIARKVSEPDRDQFCWEAALEDVVESGSSYPQREEPA